MLSSVIVELFAALYIYLRGKLLNHCCNLGKLDVFGIFTTEDIILVYNVNTFYYHIIILLSISISLIFSKKQENYEYYGIHNFQIIIFSFSKFAFFFILSNNIIGLVILWLLVSAVSVYVVRNSCSTATLFFYKLKFCKISIIGDFIFCLAVIIIFFFFETYDIDDILKNINNLSDYHVKDEDFGLSAAIVVSTLLSIAFMLKAGQLVFFSLFLNLDCRETNSIIHIYYSLLMLSFFYFFFILEPLIFIFDYVKIIYFYFSFTLIIKVSIISAVRARFCTIATCTLILQFCYFLIFISFGLKEESVFLLFFIIINRLYVAFILNTYKNINKKDFFFEKVIYKGDVVFDYERVLIFLAFFIQNIFILYFIINIEFSMLTNLTTPENNKVKILFDIITVLWFYSSLNFLFIAVILISIVKIVIILFNKKK